MESNFRLLRGIVNRDGVVSTSSWLVDGFSLFVSEDRSSGFAIGQEASFSDMSICCCGLAAVAAGCVGGNRRFPPPLGRSPSSVLCSGSAEEFVFMPLPL